MKWLGGGVLLPATLAATAWLSQSPYFIWSHRQTVLAVSAAVMGAVVAWTFWSSPGRGRDRRDRAMALLLTTFAVYITAQRTVQGGHSLWVFVVPTVLAIAIARQDERRRAYRWFEAIFLASLVPGLVLLVLMIAGVPLTFAVRPPPNELFAAGGIRMLQGPGAVFIESNSQALPWGGLISRLCGMFDEPGMVGTIAALMLAVRGFDVRGWRAAGLWVAGVSSLSLAFVVLTVPGLALRGIARRNWRFAWLAVPVVAAGLVTVGLVRPPRPIGPPNIRVQDAKGEVGAPATSGAGVRQAETINNRSLPEMDALVAEYRARGPRTWLFGIASDASVVHGGASAVWTRVLTNHGILGLLLLIGAFAGYAATAVPRAAKRPAMLLFLAAFALSFYQRPVIWLPYNLLLYFGALAMLEDAPADSPPSHGSPPAF